MALFAETFVLKINVPFSEYWLPLLIGMGVGVCALGAARLVFGKRQRPQDAVQPRQPQVFNHDPFTQGSTSEQRKSYRRQGNPTEIYIAHPDAKDRPARAWVIDRSIGGLCIHASTEYLPSSVLTVLPVNAPEMTPWVDIEVRTCRQVKDVHELGCQFVKTPNWSVLLMFG